MADAAVQYDAMDPFMHIPLPFRSHAIFSSSWARSFFVFVSRPFQQGLRQQSLDIGFGVAVCATSLLRFLSDHVNVLPLGVVARLLHTHDVLLALVPLVESPPWTRRRSGRLEKFSDQRWTAVAPRDAAMMTKLEGQVWLTVYNLLMDKACRKQYQFNTHRKEVLVRVRENKSRARHLQGRGH